MEHGFPPGGLERLFRSYDRIVAHGMPSRKEQKEEPPWATPAKKTPAGAPKGPPEAEQFVGDVPRQSAGDIQADRMERSQRLIEEKLRNPNGASLAQDERGLENAYKEDAGVYYDPDTRTEYIKGSSTRRDWYDDLTKIPVWGDTRGAERYQQADKAYTDLQAAGKPVDRVVGHSLGGSVALELAQNRGIAHSRTFGAPVLDMNPFGRAERYRHPLDPVSILDRKAKWGGLMAYPHSYTGYMTE